MIYKNLKIFNWDSDSAMSLLNAIEYFRIATVVFSNSKTKINVPVTVPAKHVGPARLPTSFQVPKHPIDDLQKSYFSVTHR